MKTIIPIISAILLLTSCEKTVHLNYQTNQSRIIIEGNITNTPGPYLVKITKSIPLSDTAAYPTIDNATITLIDDAGNAETLTALGNGTYRTAAITGTEGRTYTLTVNAENQTYTAQSTMPKAPPFDSIKIEEATFIGKDKEYNIIPVYTDPIAKGSCYRFVLSVNNKLINQHFIQNDDIRNGLTNTVRLEINDDDLKLKSKDNISIEMQCIDQQTSLYYTTLSLIADNGPGGGTTPNNPPNNFSNGALGLFSAHTTQTKSAAIP